MSGAFWPTLGLLLAVWVIWDLFSGTVYLHRQVKRAHEPALYWCGMLIWSLIAASCFAGGYYV